jgi:hypothetical protein
MAAEFEPLRDRLEGLSVPKGEARKVIWIVGDRLGAALTAVGSYEIFLAGGPLKAASNLVERHLQHDLWVPERGGETFEATRILLGSASHFAAIAALIATEIARLDLSSDDKLQQAFLEVEPIIEMAIRRSTLSDEALLGLIAELYALKAALVSVPKDERPTVMLGWRGWTRGRDFEFGSGTLEVKATAGSQSRHHFSGVHQLEPNLLESGEAERLGLLSLGLAETDDGGQSLPEIVDDLLSLLDDGSIERGAAQQQLLSMIAEYGEGGGAGYEHDKMSGWVVYQRHFTITFGRLYDVADPAMRLLTREAIEQTFAVVDSVTFSLLLPERVSAFNPSARWQEELAAIVRHAHAPAPDGSRP